MTDNELIIYLWKQIEDMIGGGVPDQSDFDKITVAFINKGFMSENDDLWEIDLNDQNGWVYIVYIGKGMFKIGEKKNLDLRLKQINPKEILRTIRTNRKLLLEKQLHDKYGDVRLSPSQEVFNLTDAQILEIHQMSDEVKYTSKNSII